MRSRIRVVTALFLGWILVIGSNQALAQGGTWTTKAPMPTPRSATAVGVINGQLYVVGGPGCCGNVNEVYNPTADSWMSAAPAPTGRNQLAAGVISGKLHVVGGTNSGGNQAIHEVFDPGTNAWGTLPSMIFARIAPVAGVIAGKLFVAGGAAGAQGQQVGNLPTTSLEVYDPVTNSWSLLTPMFTARTSAAAGVVNGKLYVVGGVGLTNTVLNSLEEYDPAANVWTIKAPIPSARQQMAAAVANGKLYVIGGQDASNNFLNTVEAYDPNTDTWTTETPMPTARAALGAAEIGGLLYAVGGGTTVALGTLEVFTPGEANTPGKVTGGGFIQPDGTMTPATLLIQDGINAGVGDKATFGLVVQLAAGDPNPTGNLQYKDHAANVTITALSFTLLTIGDGVCGANTHAKIRGSATVTGPSGSPSTQDFEVEVDDCGGPSSTLPDTFKITTTGPTSYMAMGPVIGGNITIHTQ